MSGIDWSILSLLLLLSAVFCLTGLLRHLLALMVLALAALAAWRFGPTASEWLEPYITFSPMRIAVAYLGVFIAVSLLGSLLSALISKLIAAAGLAVIDRVLGGVGGLLLGLVVCWAVFAAMRSAPVYSFEEREWWSDSVLIPLILSGGDAVAGVLGWRSEDSGEIRLDLQPFLDADR